LTFSWLHSYHTSRISSVRIGRHCSSSVTCTTGVPHGSVLGPLLFTAYVSPIAGIAHLYSIDQQQYADDTQLFISLSPSDYMPDLDNLTRCIIDSLYVWFYANGMALNPDKSEAIFLFCKSFPLQPFFFFFMTSYMIPQTFTVTSEYIRFYFLVFLFYTF